MRFEAKCVCGGRITGDTIKWRHDVRPAKRHTAEAIGKPTQIDAVAAHRRQQLARNASLFALPTTQLTSAGAANYAAVQAEIWEREAVDGSPNAANQALLQQVIAAQQAR